MGFPDVAKSRWQDLNNPDQRPKGGFKSIQRKVCSDHTAIYAGKHNGGRTRAGTLGCPRWWVAIAGSAAGIRPAA
jgi:hypothetical protein